MKKIIPVSGILCLLCLGLILVSSQSWFNLVAQTKPGGSGKPAIPTGPLADTSTLTKKSISDVVKLVMPGVVHIKTKIESIEDEEGIYQGILPEQGATGTGMIIDAKNGYILTNAHVIRDSKEIMIVLNDKRQFTSHTVGTDPIGDVAVVQINNPPADLCPVFLGDSNKIEVGELVVAIGNPYGLRNTVTSGIISAWRELENSEENTSTESEGSYIQTDALINPGNSGGPLCNLRGQVIGVNSLKLTQAELGLAIPINRAKKIADVLIKGEKYYRPFLGVQVTEISAVLAKFYNFKDVPSLMDALKLKEAKGAFVVRVKPDSPAATAGLQEHDVIVEFAGKKIDKPADFNLTLDKSKIDSTVDAKIIRDGNIQTLKVTIGKR